MEQIKGLEWLYDLYSQDPSRLSEEWRDYFSHGLAYAKPSLPPVFAKTEPISHEEKKLLVHFLHRSAVFEHFIHTKYVGQKRFSLEGADIALAILARIFETVLEEGGEEIVLGMTHRGRLNVMANLLQVPLVPLFHEFSGRKALFPQDRAGDVRYHLGCEGRYASFFSPRDSLPVTLLSNPSHLESICPVLQGVVRAKQERMGKHKVLPVQLHGDAAFAGQGVVYETLQLSGLKNYETGGTLHLILDNAIGFTTSPEEGRSTKECSDLAKAFDFPVFHLYEERPEECIAVVIEALSLRAHLQRDLFLHLHCFRKYGHNEIDEPTYTHPREYKNLRELPSAYVRYREQLLQEAPEIVQEESVEFQTHLEKAWIESETVVKENFSRTFVEKKLHSFVLTEIEKGHITSLLEIWCQVPPQFSLHPKLQGLVQERKEIAAGHRTMDWATAEGLALGVLLSQGTSVRLVGQDTVRGTFSQRHACWVDTNTGELFFPFQAMAELGSSFTVCNTPLSEMAALGFEYGYSVWTSGLVLWEAQFGDFANGAQVMIDQYVSSGEEKWGQKSRLTLLLPHGYEGQGPEHSSARIERFLSLSAHDNWLVVQPTTPSQFFHLLVRQGRMSDKKPLIVFTPKALLRHLDCRSSLEDLSRGHFTPLIVQSGEERVDRVLFCTGKIAFSLEAEKKKRGKEGYCVVRLEQLYPFPEVDFLRVVQKFSLAREWVWVQEEPENMGAWPFLSSFLKDMYFKDKNFRCVMPKKNPSPATGSAKMHHEEQKQLFDVAFAEGG